LSSWKSTFFARKSWASGAFARNKVTWLFQPKVVEPKKAVEITAFLVGRRATHDGVVEREKAVEITPLLLMRIEQPVIRLSNAKRPWPSRRFSPGKTEQPMIRVVERKKGVEITPLFPHKKGGS
jgi:hypothetical protein